MEGEDSGPVVYLRITVVCCPKKLLTEKPVFGLLWVEHTETMIPSLPCFVPHPHLSDQVNHNIAQSQIEGGVFLEDLAPDTVLEIDTKHHRYKAVVLGNGLALISGHPRYCPQPTLVGIAGSTWGGSMLKLRFVGRGMHLEFHHPEYHTPIVTSRIQEIRECSEARHVRMTSLA